MTVQILSNVGPDRIDIAYEGLGAQLIGWPDGFCDALVAHKLQVIRFDNRDAGLSTHFSSAPVPNFVAALAGDTSSAAYTLSSMAADAVGLLEGLGIDSAHLVGASMGGFIAQTIAIEHPARVRSLTSIMSSTGDPTVGQPRPQAMAIFASPPATNRDEAIQRTVNAVRILGSPGFPADLDAVTDRAARAYDPPGIVRQAVAVIASGDRTARLRSLDVPALVIHGADDPMCDVSGGRATAAAIPAATLAVFDGMGHDLPRALWPDFASRIAELVRISSSA
jgi:pimeloyl-ACP methyl ester carboxylesterase